MICFGSGMKRKFEIRGNLMVEEVTPAAIKSFEDNLLGLKSQRHPFEA